MNRSNTKLHVRPVVACGMQETTSTALVGVCWQRWLPAEVLVPLVEHPLLLALERREVDTRILQILLAQHAHYSHHFTRYLVALIAHIDDPDDMRQLHGNLLEEMGIDQPGQLTHAELFQRTLSMVGADPREMTAFPETQALVDAMLAHCMSGDPVRGLAAMCLGAEAIVPLLYRPIRTAMASLGFGKEAQTFFTLHIEEDEEHAITMLRIMERMVGDHPGGEALVRATGRQMIGLRARMLDAVWRAARPCATLDEDASPGEPTIDTQVKPFDSGDFGKITAHPAARLPTRLHHARVADSMTAASREFSDDRRHAVHLVDLPSHTLSMTLGRLRSGEQTRLHRHNYETIIYVVEGEGRSLIGDRQVEWTAGDAFYVPAWALHRHTNTGTGGCLYVACENAPLLQNLGGIALREEFDMPDGPAGTSSEKEHV